MRRSGKQVAIFAGSMVITFFAAADKVGRDLAVATLSGAELAEDTEIAAAFGVHRNTVRRLAARVQEGGVAALLPPTRVAPPPQTKLTEQAKAIVAERAGKASPAEIAAEVAEQTGVAVTPRHVRRLVAALLITQPRLGDDDDPTSPKGSRGEEGAGISQDPPVGCEEPSSAQVEPGTSAGFTYDRSAGAVLSAQVLKAGEGSASPDPCGAGDLAPAPEAGPRTEAAPAQRCSDPPVVVPTCVQGRCIGLALWYPALAALGLVEAARECFSLKRAERFGVRAVTLSLFFLYALGGSTIEAAKHLSRGEFGALIGAGRAPCVKTLRRKLAELVPQAGARKFLRALSQRFVDQGLVDTAYLYVDGHLQVYSGKANVAHHWSTKDRIACRGLMRYFVNDLKGRPLLFVPEELSGSLAKALPAVVVSVRELLGERAFTLIFDRGGYDATLFSWLRSQGIAFITYQKGDPDLPGEAFARREVRFEGKRLRFWIAEDEVTINKTGPWRRVVVRTTSGHQTPILTSLGDQVGPRPASPA
jgi:transposase